MRRFISATIQLAAPVGIVTFVLWYFTPNRAWPDVFSEQLPADVNCDGRIDISDVVVVCNYIFGGQPLPDCRVMIPVRDTTARYVKIGRCSYPLTDFIVGEWLIADNDTVGYRVTITDFPVTVITSEAVYVERMIRRFEQ